MGKLIRVVTALAKLASCACCLALAPASWGMANAADRVVLQLHRGAQFEFAGYYAALWKGFYRQAGLDVEIKPGASPGARPLDALREVIERRAQFGTGTTQLLEHAAQGSPIVLLAPIFQRSGAAIYFRSDSDFSSIRSLINARVGRMPPSNVLDLEFCAAAIVGGINPDRFKSVVIEADQALAALAERRVDAVIGSAWELPWQAQQRPLALRSFDFSGNSSFYGDGLFALQRFANAEPDTTARFREASIKGWEYALQHPDEIAARIAELPGAEPGLAQYQRAVASNLAQFPEVPLGHSDPERWNAIQQGLIATGAIAHPLDLKEFFYDSGEEDGAFSRRFATLIVAGSAIFGLLIGAVAISRRLRHWTGRAHPSVASTRLFEFLRLGLARLRALTVGSSAVGAIDLNAALTGVEESIRRSLPGDVKLRLSLHRKAPLCRGEPDCVAALVRLLVAEAVSDMPKGGEVVIGTRQFAIGFANTADFPGSVPGNYLRLTVRDNGHGFPAERLSKIFYPLETARPGAAAAWRLTRRLGAFATVESAEGVGTAVHLYFRAAANRKTADLPVANGLLHAAE